ncbi:unnamed protein product [Effrenium voratum]|nr:unnamed protein product [Effrenium voratum]|mmetsp:Transcript_72983/g.174066  ORF Transcript_72983/g.174066 Transcript_72983/m.174066 type:complete len:138 (+) Transcript_72983:40-453(+)|eukprot:CAMPEP_0181478192 /NCGR_PEP_ID=MMETSP1110-20121109/42615_1 /TAXON_ID=174948 /ORGANISM="Symbiodinium sp., Strain CCMP421" /LENGTH=137 /DNA_ID=CAMNT_0023603537 /DNA_START=40 /DNA_END=453 /DNA_ORIENTATION=+
MSSSGVAVADECVNTMMQIKMRKALRYATFKISDDNNTIVVDETGDTSKTYADFLKALPEASPRYALVDFDFTTDEGLPQTKLVSVFWSPDDKAGLRERMLYASSRDAIQTKFEGIMPVQANGIGELSEPEMLSKVR